MVTWPGGVNKAGGELRGTNEEGPELGIVKVFVSLEKGKRLPMKYGLSRHSIGRDQVSVVVRPLSKGKTNRCEHRIIHGILGTDEAGNCLGPANLSLLLEISLLNLSR